MMWTHLLQALRPTREAHQRPAVLHPALRPPPPVLVGVDGSPASVRALEWATVRAVAGHTSLHIVHAFPTTVWIYPYGMTPCWDDASIQCAKQVLADAVACARRHDSHVPISTSLRGAHPAAALVDEGRDAELIVLGRRHGRRGRGWPTSVTHRVAGRARGRVVVVGPDDEFLI